MCSLIVTVESWTLNLQRQVFEFRSLGQRDGNESREGIYIGAAAARGVHISETDFDICRKPFSNGRCSNDTKWRIAVRQGSADNEHLLDVCQALACCCIAMQ